MTGPAGSSVLRTERLELAPFAHRDADALLALFRIDEVRRYLLDGALVDRAWVEEEIAASERRFREAGSGLWTVRRPPAPEIIGFAGFRPFFEPPRLQLLYGLAPSGWGQGLATEAARAVCVQGFEALGLERIEAAVDVPNWASAAVLERLGMRLERTTPDGPDGTAFYALEREAP